MRAAVLNKAGDSLLEVRDDVELVDLGPDEVRVRIGASGICHSDLSAINGGLWIPTPAVMGHEGAGVVDAIGENVTHVKPGDHVVIAVSVPCGECRNCLERKTPHLCGNLFFEVAGKPHFRSGGQPLAAMGAIGTFCGMVTIRKESAIVVPDDVPFEVAALLGCGVTSGLGAVLNTVQVTAGSSVVVIGLGGVGIAALQGARLAGAEVVLGVDTVESRTAQARQFGATHTCAPEELQDLTTKLTGDGFDYAFEAAGSAIAMRAAYDSARRGGTACVIGQAAESEQLCLSASEIYYNEKRLTGSYHGSADFASDIGRFIEYWRTGALDLAGMITHRFGLEDINEGFRHMAGGVGIRSVVTSF
ncbi:zinc-binding dehydrogenase [Streptomyces sp. CG1]|uniref:zinc-binding dehydrogenase n=1 Tax=Streptomyces sp. CG1 TaxID=1287523 RepID=UPI0034E1FC60